MYAVSSDRGPPAPSRSFLATLAQERKSNVSDDLSPTLRPWWTGPANQAEHGHKEECAEDGP